MFTGIIEEVGRIHAVQARDGGRRLTIAASFADALSVDESVSINGACQTVVRADADTFDVVSIEETLRKTTFGALEAGDAVNLERALQPGDRLDGHFVQGHVDGTGTVVDVTREGTDWLYTVEYPADKAAYLIPVGSVALDGISLTVARLTNETLTVAIIPHTYAHTTVAEWAAGTPVNIEFDMVGKYVVRALQTDRDRPDATALAQQWLDASA
ncbi:riboflavin synthase [Salisaeta longa]|uniref:riboflavin synthase n=1 Tax=Salisaeta longa TaxID=503170 RepID=UPI0003B79A6B|nr:riboflavin synthase [Salisaeta longa]